MTPTEAKGKEATPRGVSVYNSFLQPKLGPLMLPPPDVTHSPPIQSSLIPEPYISPFSFKSAQRGHGLVLVALSFLQQFLLCLHHQKKRSLCQFHPSLKYLSVFSLFVSINLSQRRYSWRTPTCRSVFSVCKLQYPLFFSSIQLFPFV